MKRFYGFFLLVGVVLILAACGKTAREKPAAAVSDPKLAAAAFQKSGCTACHVIPGVPGAVGKIGPDLSKMGQVAGEQIASDDYTGTARTAEDYIHESITEPDAYVPPDCPSGPCGKGIMPEGLDENLTKAELASMISFLAGLPDSAVNAAPTGLIPSTGRCGAHRTWGIAIGTDPENHPEEAWKVVRKIELPGSGSLFLKTHPNSKWIWVDMTMNPDPAMSRTVCVIARDKPEKPEKCWEIATYGRAVHMEYNRQGTEVWISVWGDASKPGETGEIVVYDDATLTEKARIKDLNTPTGKFNVYNTVHDVY